MIDATLLHRQVHPSWVQQGRVTSQAFAPTPKDRKRLSVYDGDQITASNAWTHFTLVLQFSSIGVLAVLVAECRSPGLSAYPDPTPFSEHAVIDFSPFSDGEIKRKAKQLKALADLRGWQYRAGQIG